MSRAHFIHNQQEEDPVFGTCLTPTQARPIVAPEYLLYTRYFRFILPAAFAVTVKQGNSQKEAYKKYKIWKDVLVIVVVNCYS